MALDPHYILGAPLEETFISKDTSLPLAGGFVYFYRDSSRITAKTVYELAGSPPNYHYTPLPNPMELSAVGTPQNNSGENVAIYYYPYDVDGEIDLYYIVVKDADGVEQFTREAWPPGVASSSTGTNNSLPVQNQISNPQFTRVSINDDGITYTVSGPEQTFEFAPNWEFQIAGTGTVTVIRSAITGTSAFPTNPPYTISVNVGAGVSYCYLRQRFYHNSGLWGSTENNAIFLSTNIVAKTNSGGDQSIQMWYNASSGTNGPVLILDGELVSGAGFVMFTGGSAAAIPQSDNGDTSETGYVDIYIQFALSSVTEISSVQVVPTFEATEAAITTYDETSANRDQALMGDYYIPRLEYKPISSLLTGWDFPLNPAQFNDVVSVTSGTPKYIWDQTIADCIVNDIDTSRNPVTNGLTITPDGANGAFYVMQYLTGSEAKKLLGTRLSVNINAYNSGAASAVTARVYLFRSPIATAIPTLPAVLGTIASTGVFTRTLAGWTEIPRSGLDTPKVVIEHAADSTAINDIVDYGFSGWEVITEAELDDTENVAIVVTFSYIAATDVNIDSISLVPGDIPTRPAAKTKSDTLSECQYYYEKSYNSGTNIATVTSVGALLLMQDVFLTIPGPAAGVNRNFSIQYNIPKRKASTVTVYSPITGLPDNVYMMLYYNYASTGTPADKPISSWTLTNNGSRGVAYVPSSLQSITGANPSSAASTECFIILHYVADCRLGII